MDKSWAAKWFQFGKRWRYQHEKIERTGRQPTDAQWGRSKERACRSSEAAGLSPRNS
jgi:hypothetical protein